MSELSSFEILLDKFFDETPIEKIQSLLKEIDDMNFDGVTVKEYFKILGERLNFYNDVNDYLPEPVNLDTVYLVSDNLLNTVWNTEFNITNTFCGFQTVINFIGTSNFKNLNQEPFEAGENNYALAA